MTAATDTELADLRAERDRAVLRRHRAVACLTSLVTAAEAYVFGAAGEPLNGPRLAEARVALGDAITEAWVYLRPEGPPPHGYDRAATLLADEGLTVDEAIKKHGSAAAALAAEAPTHAEAVEIAPSVARMMANLARTHQAVTYDAHDRHATMIEAAARAAGLVPVPSTTVQPRTIRGCALPPGVDAASLDPTPAVEAALAALVDAARPILASLHAGGRAAGRIGAVDRG